MFPVLEIRISLLLLQWSIICWTLESDPNISLYHPLLSYFQKGYSISIINWRKILRIGIRRRRNTKWQHCVTQDQNIKHRMCLLGKIDSPASFKMLCLKNIFYTTFHNVYPCPEILHYAKWDSNGQYVFRSKVAFFLYATFLSELEPWLSLLL